METRKLETPISNHSPWVMAPGPSAGQAGNLLGSAGRCRSIAAIHRALELGVNWIDTAAVYGLGHSEEVVARAVKEWRGPAPTFSPSAFCAGTKKGKVYKEFSAESVRRECEDSLRRLQVETIDLYQMHWPPDDGKPGIEEAWQTLAALKSEGKVAGSASPISTQPKSSAPKKLLRSLLCSRLTP